MEKNNVYSCRSTTTPGTVEPGGGLGGLSPSQLHCSCWGSSTPTAVVFSFFVHIMKDRISSGGVSLKEKL